MVEIIKRIIILIVRLIKYLKIIVSAFPWAEVSESSLHFRENLPDKAYGKIIRRDARRAV